MALLKVWLNDNLQDSSSVHQWILNQIDVMLVYTKTVLAAWLHWNVAAVEIQ